MLYKIKFQNIVSVVLIFICFSCQEKEKKITKQLKEELSYAKGFSIEDFGEYKKVIIKNAYKNADKSYEFLLVPKKQKVPPHKASVQVIRTPVERIVATSSSYIPILELLNSEKTLVGFPNVDFISSQKTRALIDNNSIQELGKTESMNTELLLALQPELVMSFAVDETNKSFSTMQKMGIPVLLNGDWVEKTPLARAEWIKLFGVLYNKEQQADSIFNNIATEYFKAKKIAKKAKNKPTILSGSIFQDVWYLPAGESFIAQYFKDAQTNYIWKDSKGAGSLSLNFENVYIKGRAADLWIGCSSSTSKKQLILANSHYQNFEAYKNNKVFTFANYKGDTGGLFYFELGPIQPHVILKDIIKIAHPELLPDYKTVFFEQLK